MNLASLLKFLVGRRKGILDVATERGSLWLGLLFVVSAGFAREYDAEDLAAEPWHLGLPLVASLATSFTLFCILFGAALRHAKHRPLFFPMYRRFLSLYWMTAPLAWIYAIPVERFLSEVDATKANLWFLGIVSVWRVLLISRSASVIFGAPFLAIFLLVLFFADTLALVLMFWFGLPLLNIMGGVQRSASEAVISDNATIFLALNFLLWPIFFIASIVILCWRKGDWEPLDFSSPSAPPVSRGLWALAATSFVGWFFVLPWTQPPQHLRRQAERDLRGGRIEQALQEMSRHPRDAFPPYWDPPPRPGYREKHPPLASVLEQIDPETTATWVKTAYAEKLIQHLGLTGYFARNFNLTDTEFEIYMAFLERTPEAHPLIKRNAYTFTRMLQDDREETEPRKERIRAMLTAARVKLLDPTEQDEER